MRHAFKKDVKPMGSTGTIDGITYYEQRVDNEKQVEAAFDLLKNYKTWESRTTTTKKHGRQQLHIPAMSLDKLKRWVYQGIDYGNAELWLLFHFEKPIHRYTKTGYQDGLTKLPPKVLANNLPYQSVAYDALAIFVTEANEQVGRVAACRAFCRDPWAPVGLTGVWFDRLFTGYAGGLHGANEQLILLADTDLEMLSQLKRQGYYCWGTDPENPGYYRLSKILEPRSRSSLPVFSDV